MKKKTSDLARALAWDVGEHIWTEQDSKLLLNKNKRTFIDSYLDLDQIRFLWLRSQSSVQGWISLTLGQPTFLLGLHHSLLSQGPRLLFERVYLKIPFVNLLNKRVFPTPYCEISCLQNQRDVRRLL